MIVLFADPLTLAGGSCVFVGVSFVSVLAVILDSEIQFSVLGVLSRDFGQGLDDECMPSTFTVDNKVKS